MPNKQKVLFVDTVGFLNDLPHHLIDAFKATLEEVVGADILLHIVNASHPKASEQADAVYEVLGEMGVLEKPIITVLNKIDIIPESGSIDRLSAQFDRPVRVSATKHMGFDQMFARILEYTAGKVSTIEVLVPCSDPKTLSMIYEEGHVLKREDLQDSVRIVAEVPVRLKNYLSKVLDI